MYLKNTFSTLYNEIGIQGLIIISSACPVQEASGPDRNISHKGEFPKIIPGKLQRQFNFFNLANCTRQNFKYHPSHKKKKDKL
jgi:hypothetical protein